MLREQAIRLNSIGFDWQLSGMYHRLVAYNTAYGGNTRNPFQFDKDPELERWVDQQLRDYFEGRLSSERKSFLNWMGFDWMAPWEKWDGMYERLVEYKRIMQMT